MSRLKDLAEEFFERYDEPEIDELTVGFSGIDPPLKVDVTQIDHEKLQNLLGGDDIDGHYHLTKELWEYINELFNEFDFDGGYPSTPDTEYLFNEQYWFDGGFADTDDDIYDENDEKWVDGGFVEW